MTQHMVFPKVVLEYSRMWCTTGSSLPKSRSPHAHPLLRWLMVPYPPTACWCHLVMVLTPPLAKTLPRKSRALSLSKFMIMWLSSFKYNFNGPYRAYWRKVLKTLLPALSPWDPLVGCASLSWIREQLKCPENKMCCSERLVWHKITMPTSAPDPLSSVLGPGEQCSAPGRTPCVQHNFSRKKSIC